MREHNFSEESFIGGWYMPELICDNLISFFNNNKDKLAQDGMCGNTLNDKDIVGVNKNIKDSTDIEIAASCIDPLFIEYRNTLQICLEKYAEKYDFVNHYERFNVNTKYLMQYYLPNGGFKKWHFENQAREASDRILVFMTYLNDVDDGGTEFYYQKLISPCKKGLTLIWPVGFTHTHKGQISSSKEKYIVTGWFTYN